MVVPSRILKENYFDGITVHFLHGTGLSLTIELPTERLLLRPPKPEDALDLLHYYHANRDHLRPWEPQHPDDFYTLPKLQQSLIDRVEAMEKGHAIHWLLISRKSGLLQGECNVTAIIRGPFQACYLGFSIAQAAQGQGLMYEALSTAIDFIFRAYRLNRIMANYRPENRRCGKLLARLGFEIEGKARAYLKINGLWEDVNDLLKCPDFDRLKCPVFDRINGHFLT